ncbi:MAG: NAD(P)H-dependent oxidoreductase subunit E [Candidatus Marinimicrobia bacterium]|nr:NAD(P)H-dependent oxidoreductase subunit E [Candidatus Neomarinimicrobiota bacterium]
MGPENTNHNVGAALVLGGGIGGMQAALDLVESGIKVYLVEKNPSIGGVMAQLDKTFPTNDCAMCTMAPRLVEIGRHKDIELITMADIESVSGEPGHFHIKMKKRSRFVDEDKCTGCGICAEQCPVRKVIYVTPGEELIEIAAEDQDRISRIVADYKDSGNGLLPVLEDANDEFGYLSAEVIKYIARELNYPLSVVYRLATFYNAFSLTPRGKVILKACLGTACYVKGGKRILESIKKKLDINIGETTPDLQFSLEVVNCLGCCGQSPIMTANDDIYGFVKQSMVSDVLKKYA